MLSVFFIGVFCIKNFRQNCINCLTILFLFNCYGILNLCLRRDNKKALKFLLICVEYRNFL